jgi:hypothetical protein
MSETLKAWQTGKTGYPLVDAGMRELWHTGVMHNRVRMVVASFLVKHLLLPWQKGEEWFWDTLVDADLANNAAAGNGLQDVGRMPLLISAFSIPLFKVKNLTQGQIYKAMDSRTPNFGGSLYSFSLASPS